MPAKKKDKKQTKKKTKTTGGKKTSKKDTTSSAKVSIKKKEKNVMKSKLYIALVIFLIVAGTLYLLRDKFLAAMVGGTPITRFTVLKELEGQSGQQVLDQLVNETLILQEAKEQGVDIPEANIDAEIEKIQKNLEEQGQSLQDLLAFQGMTMEDLEGRIDTQLTLEKLLEDRVVVEQEEVDDFIEQSSEQLPEDMSAEEIEELAREQLVQSKLQTEIQKFLEELKNEANIQYFGAYQSTDQ